MSEKLKVCECCGHPLPTLEVQLELTRHQRSIFKVVQSAGQMGIPFRSLVDRVYGDHPDGGPVNADVSVHVARIRMQPKLAEFGMTITTSGGHYSAWRLETLSRTERQHGEETARASA